MTRTGSLSNSFYRGADQEGDSMRITLLFVGLVGLAGCSYLQSSKAPANPPRKATGITEQTCYQDCRNDLQTDEFCRARCSD
jgi:hypothetical protein